MNEQQPPQPHPQQPQPDGSAWEWWQQLPKTGGDGPIEFGVIVRHPVIDALFAAYDAAHPEIYIAFRDQARRLRALGYRQLGARWICELAGIDGTYSARYARKLMENEPRFAGAFAVVLLDQAHWELPA